MQIKLIAVIDFMGSTKNHTNPNNMKLDRKLLTISCLYPPPPYLPLGWGLCADLNRLKEGVEQDPDADRPTQQLYQPRRSEP